MALASREAPTPWAFAGPEGKPIVLVISPETQDHAALRAVLPAQWQLLRAQGLEEGRRVLCNGRVAVVVAACHLGERSWLDILSEIQASNHSPAPRLVVVSRLADERLWAEVLNRGAYDLLLKPFHCTEAAWVISQAFLDWKRENDARSGKALNWTELNGR